LTPYMTTSCKTKQANGAWSSFMIATPDDDDFYLFLQK